MAITMTTLNCRSDWMKHRQRYIGGSEISSVIGENPYLSNQELWEIKVGYRLPDDISKKPYVDYGVKAEPLLRKLLKLDFPQYKVEYRANNSWHNDKYPWAAASLDGWLTEKKTGRRGILEIKTTNILQSMQREKWNNQIPNNYFAQTCFYLAVTEFDFCVLKAQLKSEFDGIPYIQTRHYYFERSEVQEDINYLMKKGEEFWEYVRKEVRPPLVLPNI